MSQSIRRSLVGAGRVARVHAKSLVHHVRRPGWSHRDRTGHRATKPRDVRRRYALASLEEGSNGRSSTRSSSRADLHACRSGRDGRQRGQAHPAEKPMALNLKMRYHYRGSRGHGCCCSLASCAGSTRKFVARQRHRGGRDRAPHADQVADPRAGAAARWARTSRRRRELAEVNSHDWDCVRMAEGIRLRASIRRSANFKGAARGVDTDISTITYWSTSASRAAAWDISGVCPCDYGYDARVEIVARRASCRSATCAAGGRRLHETATRACSPDLRTWRSASSGATSARWSISYR